MSPRHHCTELLTVTTSVGGNLALHLKRKLNCKRESLLFSPDLASLILDPLGAELETEIWVSVTYGGRTLRRRE